jgi:hypothetical protein
MTAAATRHCNCSILGGTTDSRPCPIHDAAATWRAFVGDHDAKFVTVIEYVVVRGAAYSERNSRMVGIQHVPHAEAVRLMRGAS